MPFLLIVYLLTEAKMKSPAIRTINIQASEFLLTTVLKNPVFPSLIEITLPVSCVVPVNSCLSSFTLISYSPSGASMVNSSDSPKSRLRFFTSV
ncbi:hypothetical protein CMI46_02340 [Candidatus Pacearchaeota archaeon]|nr:hypothetical protein [Candidatus Pacearchaeota archaeon]